MKPVHTLSPVNTWVGLYGDYLYSIAVFKTNDEILAQDLVQETFLSALKSKEQFKGESTEKTWLSVILNNKIIDYYRKKNRNAEDYLHDTNDSFHQSFFRDDAEEWGHWKQESAPQEWNKENADTRLNNNELKKVIEYCLRKLPPSLAPAFMAKYMDEKNADKICKELNISSSNYWTIIHRAKVLLRACLEKNWYAA